MQQILYINLVFCQSVQLSPSVVSDSLDCNTPGLPVDHQLPEFTQTHVHCFDDAIQPSHLLSSPSPNFTLSLHDALPIYGLQHTRPPCPSSTPRACSNSCPSSQWCHPTISSSVICFSSCLQSFPASGSFQMNQLFAAGGQSIGASASTSVLPMNIQDWFPLGLARWISLSPRDSQESSPTPQFKSINFLELSFLCGSD